MNLSGNPTLLDQLAACYALGALRGGARRRFEAMARQSPVVRARALIWQERLASLTELQQSEAPSANVWKRIENTVAAERAVAASERDQVSETPIDFMRRAVWRWRLAAATGAFATVVAWAAGLQLSRQMEGQQSQLAQATQQSGVLARDNAALTARLQATPNIQYVAVLADDKAAASMLVTFDPARRSLMLKRVGAFHETADQSLQLWALPAGGGGPRSLGVLGSEAAVRMTADERQVAQIPALAVSLEPKGGAPAGSGPTGPVLFKGALLQTL